MKKVTHLRWSIPHTTELLKTLIETAKIRHIVPHGNRERSLLLTGHGFIDLMTRCSGCHIVYEQQTRKVMVRGEGWGLGMTTVRTRKR